MILSVFQFDGHMCSYGPSFPSGSPLPRVHVKPVMMNDKSMWFQSYQFKFALTDDFGDKGAKVEVFMQNHTCAVKVL